MRGASRWVRDKKGNRPIDLVADIKNERLQKELKTALEDDSAMCDFLMLKTVLKKTERSLQMPIAFLVFFDLIYAILILVLFPGKYFIVYLF